MTPDSPIGTAPNVAVIAAADPFRTTDEVAARYRRSRDTLKQWRRNGVGPAYVRIGRRVLYRESALQAWEAACDASTPRGAA